MLTSPEALASAGPGPRWGGLLGVGALGFVCCFISWSSCLQAL